MPETLYSERLVIRRWRRSDTVTYGELVTRNLGHLEPWVSWVVHEPLGDEQRRAQLFDFEESWRRGGTCVYGAFVGDVCVGVGDLHPQLERGVCEVGYWLDRDWLGQGYATELAEALVGGAFMVVEVEVVELHHDRANSASRRVAERLGMTFVGACADGVEASGEDGIDWGWTVNRAEWAQRNVQ